MDSSSTAFEEGAEKEVKIPMSCMLVSLMESIGSPSPTIFECTKIGDGVFETTVKIDISKTRVTTDCSVKIKELTGSACSTPELAESSAVQEALLYLASSHYVQVKDHSDRVAEHFPLRSNWITATKLIDAVQKIVGKVTDSLDGFSKLRMDLEVKGMSEKKNGVQTQMGDIYFEVENCLAEHIRTYNNRLKDLKQELAIFEGLREKEHEEATNEARMWRLKPHYQVAYVTEKAILDYLMDYLGWVKPIYGTKYLHDRGFKGHVKLMVPDKMKDRFGEQITVTASYPSSHPRDAEEFAAFNAVCFVEENLKLKPVDLNYPVRVKASKKHNLVVQLIENCHGLVYKVRKMWKNMNICMQETCSFYGQHYRYINQGKLEQDQDNKLALISIEFQGLVDQSLKEYNNAVEEIKKLDECVAVKI